MLNCVITYGAGRCALSLNGSAQVSGAVSGTLAAGTSATWSPSTRGGSVQRRWEQTTWPGRAHR